MDEINTNKGSIYHMRHTERDKANPKKVMAELLEAQAAAG